MSSYYLEYTKIFIAIGNNEVRERLTLQAKEIGYEVINLISKYTHISSYATLSMGCVIFPYVVIEANATIGEGCIITANTTINHDVVIQDYCLIYSQSVIRPNTVIERLTRIGNGCIVMFGVHVPAKSDVLDGSIIRESEQCITKG